MAVWFAGSTGLIAMPSTPFASKSSTMRFWAAAVPSPRRNSTVTSASSASAFSVPFLAIVQKSAALFVMNARRFVDGRSRVQPLVTSTPTHIRAAVLFNDIQFSSLCRRINRYSGGHGPSYKALHGGDTRRPSLQQLIADDADQDDPAHHGEVQR